MRPLKGTRSPALEFPDPDLLYSLVDLYFTYTNPFFPLLHRPTFEKFMSDDPYHQNVEFGMILLLVCAIGVRYSDDPRITAHGYDNPQSPGWLWFHQVQETKRSALWQSSLFDIQKYCVSSTECGFNLLASSPYGFSSLRCFYNMLRRNTIAGRSLEQEYDWRWEQAFTANESMVLSQL